MMFYMSCNKQHKLLSIRVFKFCFKIKPTDAELFSERNGCWWAIRALGVSILAQWSS